MIFYGIRARLVFTYLLIITLTVGALEAVAFWAVSEYYYGNIEALLTARAENAANFYQGYLSNTELESNTRKFLDNAGDGKVQIQVFATDGTVIADSIHRTYGTRPGYSDTATALKGSRDTFHGKDSATAEKILAVSVPLRSKNTIAGAARFTVSLEKTREVVSSLMLSFLLAGIAIILLIFFISLYLSHTITAPIQKITALSREIARGDLSQRAEKVYDDEIGVLSESINHMAEEIQKTDTLKNEFISSISHELKTPLTSIKGWAVTLDSTEPEETDVIRRGIHIINSETDRLTDMVEELLDFSRLQAGSFSLQMGRVDVGGLVREVYEQMKPRAERQGIGFRLRTEEKPVLLQADGRRLRQVLINLLDNAFKFTPAEGQVVLTTLLAEEKYVELVVEDTGCGIGQEELPRIKTRFYRGRNSGQESGIGLGLSICDELVRAHGGTLDIFSEAGQGTKVVVELPLHSR